MTMSPVPNQERPFTSKEFDRWWETQGQTIALQKLLDPDAAKRLAWEAWRKGREQMYEATAAQRLQPVPK
jgi:hypothetical protein